MYAEQRGKLNLRQVEPLSDLSDFSSRKRHSLMVEIRHKLCYSLSSASIFPIRVHM